jgi:hypothetical protein
MSSKTLTCSWLVFAIYMLLLPCAAVVLFAADLTATAAASGQGQSGGAGGVSAADAASMAYRAVQLIALLSRHKPEWLPQQHTIFMAMQERWKANCAAQVGMVCGMGGSCQFDTDVWSAAVCLGRLVQRGCDPPQ